MYILIGSDYAITNTYPVVNNYFHCWIVDYQKDNPVLAKVPIASFIQILQLGNHYNIAKISTITAQNGAFSYSVSDAALAHMAAKHKNLADGLEEIRLLAAVCAWVDNNNIQQTDTTGSIDTLLPEETSL